MLIIFRRLFDLKKALRFLALSLALILTFSLFSLTTSAAPTGTTFTAEDVYRTNKPFAEDVRTVEATFTMPTAYATNGERAGSIFSNFVGTTTACISVEIYTNGNPRVYTVYQDKNGSRQSSHVFDQVNVATGKKVHLAITIDPNTKTMKCYVDGVLKQTLNPTFVSPTCLTTNPVHLAGTPASGNAHYFKGTLYSVSIYKDIRTATEIASDKNSSVDTNDSNLIAAYELSGLPASFKDLSKNGYNAINPSQVNWLDEKEPVTDFDYSFVAIGDTQNVSHYHPEKMATIYDWVVNNIAKKKIKFVMGLGDIIDWYQNDPSGEWNNVAAAIKKMDGKVPYSLCRGNHDGVADFNKYFPYSEYKNTVGGTYDNTSILNSWRKFEINGIKYLLFTLNYSPDDNVLKWASDIIAQNPKYNVIITTHMYLNKNGTTLDGSEQYAPSASSGATHGPNDGDDIWDKLISKHDNIVLVLSGHVPSDRVVLAQTKGKNGTVVSQMLIDPSGMDKGNNPTGMVAILHFSNNGSRVTVEYYSTIRDQYYMAENQFSFDIAVIDPPKPSTSSSTSTTKPSTSATTKSTTAASNSPATSSDSQTGTTASVNVPQSTNGGQQPVASQSGSKPAGTSPNNSKPNQPNNTQNNGETQGNNTAPQTEPSASAGGTTRPNDDGDSHESDNSLTWILVGGALLIVGAFITACLLLTSKKKK